MGIEKRRNTSTSRNLKKSQGERGRAKRNHQIFYTFQSREKGGKDTSQETVVKKNMGGEIPKKSTHSNRGNNRTEKKESDANPIDTSVSFQKSNEKTFLSLQLQLRLGRDKTFTVQKSTPAVTEGIVK